MANNPKLPNYGDITPHATKPPGTVASVCEAYNNNRAGGATSGNAGQPRTRLDFALMMIARGLSVFPITWTKGDKCSCGTVDCDKHRGRHGKHPIPGSNGFKDATSSKSEAKEKWAEFPLANVAVYPGSDHVIININPKQCDKKTGELIDGMESLSNFLDMTPEDVLALTFTVKTDSEGYDLYFHCSKPYPNSVNLIPGIDVRGMNGYVLGAGSDIHGNIYEVINDAVIADLPENIAGLIDRPKQRDDRSDTALFEWDMPSAVKRVREILKVTVPAIKEEDSFMRKYRMAAMARDQWVSMEMLMQIIDEPGGWNWRCDPPWAYDELTGPTGPFRRAYEFAKHKGSNVNARAVLTGGNQSQHTKKFDPYYKCQDYTEFREQHAATHGKREKSNSPSAPFSFSPFNDWKGHPKRQPQLIGNWIPPFGTTFILGQRGIGKTVVGIDMACSIAHDLDWNGNRTEPGWYCLFLAGEDPQGTADNIAAWHIHHNRQKNERLLLPDADSRILPNLTKREDCQLLVDSVRLQIPEGSRVAIFLDTWARSAGGTDRKEGHLAQMLMENAEWMATQLNGCVVAMAHPPKHNKDTIAGGFEQENASSAIIAVEVDSKHGLQIRAERIKGGRDQHFIPIMHQEVPLPPGPDGLRAVGLVSVRQESLMTISEDDILRDHAGKLILEELQEAMHRGKPKSSLSVTHMAKHLDKREFKHEETVYQMPAESTLRHGKLKAWFPDGWRDPATGFGFTLGKEFSLEASEEDYDL